MADAVATHRAHVERVVMRVMGPMRCLLHGQCPVVSAFVSRDVLDEMESLADSGASAAAIASAAVDVLAKASRDERAAVQAAEVRVRTLWLLAAVVAAAVVVVLAAALLRGRRRADASAEEARRLAEEARQLADRERMLHADRATQLADRAQLDEEVAGFIRCCDQLAADKIRVAAKEHDLALKLASLTLAEAHSQRVLLPRAERIELVDRFALELTSMRTLWACQDVRLVIDVLLADHAGTPASPQLRELLMTEPARYIPCLQDMFAADDAVFDDMWHLQTLMQEFHTVFCVSRIPLSPAGPLSLGSSLGSSDDEVVLEMPPMLEM